MGRYARVRRGNVGFGLIVLLIVLAIGMIIYFGVGGTRGWRSRRPSRGTRRGTCARPSTRSSWRF
ncbi:MAG: hypothetical protein M5U20_12380 [Phycisphaerales bacterium]|nr:hypothetical protein [Phycisphaerales bacterium]